MATKKNEVVETPKTGLSFLAQVDTATGLPAHIDANDSRGSDNVSSADLTMPRLRLIQYISDELKKSSDSYIDGAEAGHMYDSVARELLTEAYVIPLYYERKFNLWRTRDAGGGLIASCFTEAEAREELAKICQAERIALDDVQRVEATFEIIDTPTHYCMMINPATGEANGIVVDMPSTKQKVSRAWNTEMKRRAGATFAHAWRITSVEETNKRKEDYFNYRVEYVGPITKELFDQAEENYTLISEQSKRERADRGLGAVVEHDEEIQDA